MLLMLKHAWRSWKRNKGLACLAIIALAVGIACATAIFTIINAVMLKPLPYSHPDRWVVFFGGSTLASEAKSVRGLSFDDLADYQQRTQSFGVFGWYKVLGDFNLTSPGQPEHIQGVEVTPSLVDSVGVRPVLGSLFHDSDGLHVALISSRLWKRLGAGAAIIGKPITLDGQLYTVTGVMPAWFQLPIVGVVTNALRNDVWIPINPPADKNDRRNQGFYAGYARLKPGVTIAQAAADGKRVVAQIIKENTGRNASDTVRVFGLRDFVARDIRPILFFLLGAAALLLLVTCANVAGLLAARSVSRAQETAVRVALGASRSQLALQFFLEGLFIAAAATGLGLLASVGLVRLVLSLAAEYIPRANEISIDVRVLLFVVGLAFLTALLPALAPLWQAVRTQPNEVLSDGIRASAGARSRRLSRSLVTVEIALAFLLLSVSGLLISELRNLRRTWPGFEADHVLTFQINASGTKLSEKEFHAYQDRLLGSIENLPGVRSAALVNQLPLDGCCMSTSLFPEGQPANPNFAQQLSFMTVSPSYFQTIRIPLQKGRLLNQHDGDDENLVPVVIDEAAAKFYWPNRDPIGAFGRLSNPHGTRLRVVGVVGNVRDQGLGEAARPEVYFSSAGVLLDQMKFVVRSNLPAATLIPAIRSSLQHVDASKPLYAARTMNEIVGDSLTIQRLESIVVAFFAIAALLLASLGIYSVTAFSVRERTVEIGTRMALGALRGDVLRLVVGNALKTATSGILLGALAALSVTWLILRLLKLHHISPLAFAASVIVVGGLAVLASFFPAWRATLLSPMVAIRSQAGSLWAAGRRSVERKLHRDLGAESRSSQSVSALLTSFTDASRRASSFSEALGVSLSGLRETIRCESAMLFEQTHASDLRYQCRAASPEAAAGSLPNGYLLGRLKFHHSPLAFAAGDMDTALRWASEQKPHYVAEITQLKQMGMRLAVPMRAKSEIIGLLLLGPPLNRAEYSPADKSLLQSCAQQLAVMMENARLTGRILEQEKLRRDVELAAEVQQTFLARESIETSSCSVAAFYLPARSVGGDCYDFLDLGTDRIGIALADVAGKGVAAALVMAVVQASLRILASEKSIPLPELAAKMNHYLFRSTGSSSYASFFYAQLDAEKRRLRYVTAGHNPPYLLRARNSRVAQEPAHFVAEELATGGPIIGMFPDVKYEEAAVDLCSGDVMLAFTDGVTEALNPDQAEFGEDRLKRLLCEVSHLPVPQIVSCLSQEVRNWIADAPQHDDLTFIVMKVH